MIASIKYNEPGGKKIKTPDSLKMQLKRLATDNRIYRITVVIKNQYNSLFLVPNKQKKLFYNFKAETGELCVI